MSSPKVDDNKPPTITAKVLEENDDALLLSGSRIAIHTMNTLKQCTREVAAPPDADYDYAPLKPYYGPPAKEYPFVLDPLQKETILCLNNSRSVLLSIQTSAEKTVIEV